MASVFLLPVGSGVEVEEEEEEEARLNSMFFQCKMRPDANIRSSLVSGGVDDFVGLSRESRETGLTN